MNGCVDIVNRMTCSDWLSTADNWVSPKPLRVSYHAKSFALVFSSQPQLPRFQFPSSRNHFRRKGLLLLLPLCHGHSSDCLLPARHNYVSSLLFHSLRFSCLSPHNNFTSLKIKQSKQEYKKVSRFASEMSEKRFAAYLLLSLQNAEKKTLKESHY